MYVLVSKVLLTRVLGKRVPLRRTRTMVQKWTENEYSWASAEGGCTNVVEGTHPWGEDC